mmetsp:Transcript_45084/g.121489  ORF Transcript_45084/g.121489 Transcript_45084/m.121489 type:complete len:294 (-) Transcript_45084:8-889(-)
MRAELTNEIEVEILIVMFWSRVHSSQKVFVGWRGHEGMDERLVGAALCSDSGVDALVRLQIFPDTLEVRRRCKAGDVPKTHGQGDVGGQKLIVLLHTCDRLHLRSQGARAIAPQRVHPGRDPGTVRQRLAARVGLEHLVPEDVVLHLHLPLAAVRILVLYVVLVVLVRVLHQRVRMLEVVGIAYWGLLVMRVVVPVEQAVRLRVQGGVHLPWRRLRAPARGRTMGGRVPARAGGAGQLRREGRQQEQPEGRHRPGARGPGAERTAASFVAPAVRAGEVLATKARGHCRVSQTA